MPSPVMSEVKPSKSIDQIDFPDGMREILAGRKITRQSWANDDYAYLDHNRGFLMLKRDAGLFQWLVNDGDMQATDWVIVREH